jgi:putative ABC transport system ATP-binding protein
VTGLERWIRQGRLMVPAASGLSMTIEPGESVALLGPSGSGKSVVLRLIGGLDRPDAGSVRVDDTEVGQLSARQAARYRSGIGFVNARATLLDYLSALDNVIVPVSASRVDFSVRMRARALLERTGMGHRAGVLAAELSASERQRVAIARAMIGGPRLVLADEPSGGLDSSSAEDMLALLDGFHRDHGLTLLLATADSAVASVCSRMIRLRDGAAVTGRGPSARPPFRLRPVPRRA